MKKVVLRIGVVLAVAGASMLSGEKAAFASDCRLNCGNQCAAKGRLAGCDDEESNNVIRNVCVDCDCKGSGRKMNVRVQWWKCNDGTSCKTTTPIDGSWTGATCDPD